MSEETGHYQRQYPGEGWQDVDEQRANELLSGYYKDVEGIKEQIRAGATIRTPWATWRFVKE